MTRPGKKLAHLLEYAVVRLAVALIGVLGERTALRLGSTLGSFTWNVAGFRRELVLESLAGAFPDMDSAKLYGLGRECYRNLGKVFMEMFLIHRKDYSAMAEKVTIRNREVMDGALAEGRGVITVCFHYGNWELMAARAAREGWPLDAIVRPQTNPLFNSYVNRLRESNGMRLIPVNASAGTIARELRDGRIVGFVADQDAHRVGVFVPFLGRLASTPVGPGLFAWKCGAPVVITILLPTGGDHWEMVFERVPRPETDDRSEFIRQITEYYTNYLERRVRLAPEYWFWPHKRWKTPPPE